MKSTHPGQCARINGFLVTLFLIASPTLATLDAQLPAPRGDVDQGQTRRLALADVYRLALTSPRVTAAAALAAAAEARVSSSRHPPDPELQLGFMNRSIPSLAPMDPLGMTQVEVMQMLPVPGKLGLAGRIAAAKARATADRAGDIRWETRARAAMAFHDLRAAEGQLEITRKTRLIVQDIAKVSQVMYSVGDGRQSDVLRAQVEVARMGEEILRMESMRASMSGRLAAILDLQTDALLAPGSTRQLPETLPPLATLIAEAERKRPMISAAESELAAAEAGERLARREIWPDLRVAVQYGWRGGSMGTERMVSVMLGATVPVYARSRQLRMREEAGSMRAMAAAEVAAMRADTRGRMTELYADFRRAGSLTALYRTTILPQAEGAVTAAFSAYRAGTVNLMTLLDNQMAVNRYQQELIQLEADRGKAIAEIEMLLGREIFDSAAGEVRDQ